MKDFLASIEAHLSRDGILGHSWVSDHRPAALFNHVSFLSFLWVISRILRIPDLGSVSAGPIESASNLDQDPEHCLFIPYFWY
jgi:hypothetical protein